MNGFAQDTECRTTSWGRTVYAIVGDATGSAGNVTVCGGWTSQGAEARAGARSRVVFETVGHVVEIRMPVTGAQQGGPRQRRTSFVLRVAGEHSRKTGFSRPCFQ